LCTLCTISIKIIIIIQVKTTQCKIGPEKEINSIHCYLVSSRPQLRLSLITTLVSSFRVIKKETVFTTLIDFISHKVNNTSYSKIHSICNHQKRKIPDRQKHQLNNFSTNTLGLKINTQILYKKSMSSLITKTM